MLGIATKISFDWALLTQWALGWGTRVPPSLPPPDALFAIFAIIWIRVLHIAQRGANARTSSFIGNSSSSSNSGSGRRLGSNRFDISDDLDAGKSRSILPIFFPFLRALERGLYLLFFLSLGVYLCAAFGPDDIGKGDNESYMTAVKWIQLLLNTARIAILETITHSIALLFLQPSLTPAALRRAIIPASIWGSIYAFGCLVFMCLYWDTDITTDAGDSPRYTIAGINLAIVSMYYVGVMQIRLGRPALRLYAWYTIAWRSLMAIGLILSAISTSDTDSGSARNSNIDWTALAIAMDTLFMTLQPIWFLLAVYLGLTADTYYWRGAGRGVPDSSDDSSRRGKRRNGGGYNWWTSLKSGLCGIGDIGVGLGLRGWGVDQRRALRKSWSTTVIGTLYMGIVGLYQIICKCNWRVLWFDHEDETWTTHFGEESHDTVGGGGRRPRPSITHNDDEYEKEEEDEEDDEEEEEETDVEDGFHKAKDWGGLSSNVSKATSFTPSKSGSLFFSSFSSFTNIIAGRKKRTKNQHASSSSSGGTNPNETKGLLLLSPASKAASLSSQSDYMSNSAGYGSAVSSNNKLPQNHELKNKKTKPKKAVSFGSGSPNTSSVSSFFCTCEIPRSLRHLRERIFLTLATWAGYYGFAIAVGGRRRTSNRSSRTTSSSTKSSDLLREHKRQYTNQMKYWMAQDMIIESNDTIQEIMELLEIAGSARRIVDFAYLRLESVEYRGAETGVLRGNFLGMQVAVKVATPSNSTDMQMVANVNAEALMNLKLITGPEDVPLITANNASIMMSDKMSSKKNADEADEGDDDTSPASASWLPISPSHLRRTGNNNTSSTQLQRMQDMIVASESEADALACIPVFHGVCCCPPDISLVFEWCEEGSLRSYLDQHQHRVRRQQKKAAAIAAAGKSASYGVGSGLFDPSVARAGASTTSKKQKQQQHTTVTASPNTGAGKDVAPETDAYEGVVYKAVVHVPVPESECEFIGIGSNNTKNNNNGNTTADHQRNDREGKNKEEGQVVGVWYEAPSPFYSQQEMFQDSSTTITSSSSSFTQQRGKLFRPPANWLKHSTITEAAAKGFIRIIPVPVSLTSSSTSSSSISTSVVEVGGQGGNTNDTSAHTTTTTTMTSALSNLLAHYVAAAKQRGATEEELDLLSRIASTMWVVGGCPEDAYLYPYSEPWKWVVEDVGEMDSCFQASAESICGLVAGRKNESDKDTEVSATLGSIGTSTVRVISMGGLSPRISKKKQKTNPVSTQSRKPKVRSFRSTNTDTASDLHPSSERWPSWLQRLVWALQAARVVAYMHSFQPPLLHRDIKSFNIFLAGSDVDAVVAVEKAVKRKRGILKLPRTLANRRDSSSSGKNYNSSSSSSGTASSSSTSKKVVVPSSKKKKKNDEGWFSSRFFWDMSGSSKSEVTAGTPLRSSTQKNSAARQQQHQHGNDDIDEAGSASGAPPQHLIDSSSSVSSSFIFNSYQQADNNETNSSNKNGGVFKTEMEKQTKIQSQQSREQQMLPKIQQQQLGLSGIGELTGATTVLIGNQEHQSTSMSSTAGNSGENFEASTTNDTLEQETKPVHSKQQDKRTNETAQSFQSSFSSSSAVSLIMNLSNTKVHELTRQTELAAKFPVTAKLGDFGDAKAVRISKNGSTTRSSSSSSLPPMTREKGTMQWMAPEVMKSSATYKDDLEQRLYPQRDEAENDGQDENDNDNDDNDNDDSEAHEQRSPLNSTSNKNTSRSIHNNNKKQSVQKRDFAASSSPSPIPYSRTGMHAASYGTSADIYSLGIVFWEILTGGLPYASISRRGQLTEAITDMDARPPIPRHTPVAFAHLLRMCWHPDASLRPPAHVVVSVLERLVSAGILLCDEEEEKEEEVKGEEISSSVLNKTVARPTSSSTSSQEFINLPMSPLPVAFQDATTIGITLAPEDNNHTEFSDAIV